MPNSETRYLEQNVSKGKVTEPKAGLKPGSKTEPRPTLVLKINKVAEFTEKIENECDPNFSVTINSRWTKVFSESFSAKKKNF